MVFPLVMYGCESWTIKKLSAKELMLLNCSVGEDSWESLGLQGDPTSPSERKSVLNIHWKDWWWSWSFNTLTTWCKELTLWKRPWCWESLKAGSEGDDRGWDGCMASPTWLTCSQSVSGIVGSSYQCPLWSLPLGDGKSLGSQGTKRFPRSGHLL